MAGACSREQSPETPAGRLSIDETRETVTLRSADGAVTIAGSDDAGRVTVTTGDGDEHAVSYTAGALADGFPGDIPVYDPSQIVMSQVFNTGGSAVVTLTTSHAPERVADFYLRELARLGWAVGGEMQVGGMVLFQGRKNGHILNFTALVVEGRTKINLAKTQADE
jgi:hypothetical protein